MNLESIKHIHFSGIKGVGMASLAICARDLGIEVTGSDTKEVFVTDETLKKHNFAWSVGFSSENLEPHPDLVIFTGAHAGNPEVAFARENNIPVMTLSEAQGMFAKGRDVIAVGGVGGKSTISSIIAHILDRTEMHPSFAIGVGDIPSLGTPGRFDKSGHHFILEADEFAVLSGVDDRPRFSYLSPKVLVLTNIEHDHPDLYPTIEDTKKVFAEFARRVANDGLVVSLFDNANNKEVCSGLSNVKTYGLQKGADYWIEKISFKDRRIVASVVVGDGKFEIELQVPGKFNVLNAVAALVVGESLGIDREKAVAALVDFSGVKRRLERVGEKNSVEVWDDYAHHPTEIKAAIGAIREWLPGRRIVAVFQPHTYSRTRALFSDFAQSFAEADHVVLMDVYSSARETDDLGVNSKILADAIRKTGKSVEYAGDKKETVEVILRMVKAGDVVLTMGAGDIFHIHEPLLEAI